MLTPLGECCTYDIVVTEIGTPRGLGTLYFGAGGPEGFWNKIPWEFLSKKNCPGPKKTVEGSMQDV